ncbi:hypothetical protein DFH09DRAFT_1420645 [Mycena vulgaris]|nr:hypothetical protein DFH09DRAFT_1420645 [Mycena vulgaris]
MSLQRGKACSSCRNAMERARNAISVAFGRSSGLRVPRSGSQQGPPDTEAAVVATDRDAQGTMRRPETHSSSSCTSKSAFGSPKAQICPEIQNVDTFLDKFASSELFFLNSIIFYETALRLLPFGHPNARQALCFPPCTSGDRNSPNTKNAFLKSALKTLPEDIADFPLNPRLVVQTIQAQVLLSYYYLHSARPVEGRYHYATALSLALDAGLHMLQSHPHAVHPPFPLVQTLLAPAADHQEVTERVKAFRSVLILNNYWVAVQGSSSAFPRSLRLETPWSVGVDFSPAALLVYASTWLERIITFSARTPGLGRPFPKMGILIISLKVVFRTKLSPLPGDSTLLITHALTDLAIVRLHAPYASTSETSLGESLAAAGRIVFSLGGGAGDGTYDIAPILGALSGTICSVYVNELSSLRAGENDGRRQAEYQEIETRLMILMDIMSSFAATSPVIQHYLAVAGQAYAFHRHITLVP